MKKLLVLLALATLPAPVSVADQTVVVCPVVGDRLASGQALLDAIAGITDAAWGKRYLLKIEPGVYDLGANPLLMKPFVDVEGSGRNVTLIRGDGRPNGSTPTFGVIHGSDNAELRDLSVHALGGSPGQETAIAIFNEGATSFRNIQISVSGGTSCWGVRSLASTPAIKDLNIWVNCSGYNSGITSRHTSQPRIEDTVIRSLGASYETGNVGVFIDAEAVPSLFRGVDITVGDSGTPGRGIYLGNGGQGGWFEIAETHIHTNGGIGMWSNVDLSLKIRHSNIVGNRIGLYLPGNWLFVHNSVLGGSEQAISTWGAARVGASQLDGGPVIGYPMICAGVYDESFTFFADQCPD